MYSIDQHGTSLGTLYSKVSAISSLSGAHAGCILALKDQDGNRFGAFVNEAFRPSKEYYGTGEWFVFVPLLSFANLRSSLGSSFIFLGLGNAQLLVESRHVRARRLPHRRHRQSVSMDGRERLHDPERP
jgi:hypothetical protein